jgi:hypothetical protein
MASLPAQHPNLTLHLVDRTLTPLITSSQTPQQEQSLLSISQAALGTHEAIQRLGMGLPQRIMVEHANHGPVLSHSFLNPVSAKSVTDKQSSANGQKALVAIERLSINDESQHGMHPASSAHTPGESEGLDEVDIDVPPLLISTVIAPNSDSVLEARRAAARLERIGKVVQARWVGLQDQNSPH